MTIGIIDPLKEVNISKCHTIADTPLRIVLISLMQLFFSTAAVIESG